jgi:hypothetical protein
MDDGLAYYIPGVQCLTCGRFVGTNGAIEVEHREMSTEVASVTGWCVNHK